MRYETDHKTRTRERILRNAARQVRAKGLSGPAVATVMKASGLTVGGFYKHFQSREHLLAEAIEESMVEFDKRMIDAVTRVPPGERWKEIVRWYLSLDHCEHADTGCPFATLAPEIARAAPSVKQRVARIMKKGRERMLEFMPGRDAGEKGRNFIVIFTAMAGAVSMARVMPKLEEKQAILKSVRDHLLESF
jgi:TetR/AcrR family transcriptional regulator, transcriptional repressor for nem operon